METVHLSRRLHDWPTFITSLQTVPPSTLQNIWRHTKGGFGAKDIFDLVDTLRPHIDEAPRDVLIIFVALQSLSSMLLGGNYGRSVGRAFHTVIASHLPHAVDCTLAELKQYDPQPQDTSLQDLLRRYVQRLLDYRNVDQEVLYAGILNHYHQVQTHRRVSHIDMIRTCRRLRKKQNTT